MGIRLTYVQGRLLESSQRECHPNSRVFYEREELRVAVWPRPEENKWKTARKAKRTRLGCRKAR